MPQHTERDVSGILSYTLLTVSGTTLDRDDVCKM